jgi:predicted pyridoxine 5'-phosphate oxidase superfamily flavin-nucleotide-binding protein
MGRRFAEIAFTPAVKEEQERHGSRRQYQRVEEQGEPGDRLGPHERAFIQARDGFYMSTISETGWPYIQYRGGPKGFLKILDDRTLGFADLGGNMQYISTGNLKLNDRVALFLMDYPHQRRLKILGHVQVYEGDSEAKKWIDRLKTDERNSRPERAYVIRVAAFDWNCPQHITQRFTIEELQILKAQGSLDDLPSR